MTNILQYFEAHLGRSPADTTLVDLPLESVCGDDCKVAIDAAKAFLVIASKADPRMAVGIVNTAEYAVTIFWRG